MKGYSGMYVVKAVTEKMGKVDPKAFAAAMKGARVSAKQTPGVLLDVTFDKNGDLDRESFLVEGVEAGKSRLWWRRATGFDELPLGALRYVLGTVMGDLIQLVVSGTATGAIYALAALGFTLLWQASGTINFAQGEFVMLPAFTMLVGIAIGLPLWARSY